MDSFGDLAETTGTMLVLLLAIELVKLELHSPVAHQLSLARLPKIHSNRTLPTETMKSFIAILLVALACLCLVQDANAWERAKTSDRFTCGTKNPDVVSAIENFCFKNTNMVSQSLSINR